MSGRTKSSAKERGNGANSGASAGGARKKHREDTTPTPTYEVDDRPVSAGLEVLNPGSSGDMASRSKAGFGSVPPRSESSLSQNRVGTPTKKVSLTAVRRKQESEAPIEPELDWREFTRSNSSLRFSSRSYSSLSRESSQDENNKAFMTEEAHVISEEQDTLISNSKRDEESDVASPMGALSLSSKKEKEPSVASAAKAAQKKEEEDEDDDDDDDDDDSEKVRKAPNELLMEFLDCVMKKEYVTAEKLCRMILIYEPDNAEAKMFHPVIMEKIQLEFMLHVMSLTRTDVEAEAEGEGEEGDDDDDDDDDDEDDDDDDDSDDSSDEDDNEEEQEGAVEIHDLPPRPDSGIGMY